MDGVFCSKLQEGDIKGALPYVIVLLIIILTVCTMMLGFPVIILIRKVSLDLGLVPFRFKFPSMPKFKSDDDEPLLDYDEEQQPNEPVHLQPPAGFEKQSHQRFVRNVKQKQKGSLPKPFFIQPTEKNLGLPLYPEFRLAHADYEMEINATTSKMFLHTRNELVDKMNILINSNNVYFTVILFLVMAIMIHMGLICVDNLMRLYDYEHMWRAIEEAKKAINTTSVPLNIMQATMTPP